MKLRIASALLLASAFLGLPLVATAADKKEAKPYPFDKCIVSDEKIGSDPNMKPYVFVENGQEVKLCCKSCLKDFNKDKSKYMSKIEAGQKKTK